MKTKGGFGMRSDDINDFYFFARLIGALVLTAASMIAVRDIAWYFFNLPSRDQTKTTKNCYDWFEHYLPPEKKEIDYSEGLFNFDGQPMTLKAATLNKYDHIFNTLGLQPGMRLLDAGCGSGVWMEYCARRGVEVIGLTLSPEQAEVVKAKGLKVKVQDYRIEDSALIGLFDRITALGSTEHVCSSMGVFANNAARNRSKETLADIWRLFQRYLKPDGKIFVTVLTWNEKSKWSLTDRIQGWVLDQHYGGYYPYMSDLQHVVAPAANLVMTQVEDRTKDYHWSSMVDRRHFGYFTIDWRENTIDKIRYLFVSLIKSPLQFPFHWLYQMLNTWMWQFGGAQDYPLTESQVQKAHAQLKYFMLEPLKQRELQTGTQADSCTPEKKLL